MGQKSPKKNWYLAPFVPLSLSFYNNISKYRKTSPLGYSLEILAESLGVSKKILGNKNLWSLVPPFIGHLGQIVKIWLKSQAGGLSRSCPDRVFGVFSVLSALANRTKPLKMLQNATQGDRQTTSAVFHLLLLLLLTGILTFVNWKQLKTLLTRTTHCPVCSGAFQGAHSAQRVLDAFGGVNELLAALEAVGVHYNRATLYKWTYERSKGGTGGYVPKHMRRYVQRAATAKGIRL